MDSGFPSFPAQTGAAPVVRLSEVLAGLSFALDLTEGQRAGHSVRSALIGMRLAEAIGLPRADRASLFHALLMKDLGCSSNAARFAALFGHDDHELKRTLKTINWSNALQSYRFVARNVAPGQFWLKRVWQVLAVISKGPEGARDVVRTRCDRGAEIATLLGLSTATVQAIRTIDEHWDGHGQPDSLAGDAIPLLGRIVGLAQTFEVFVTTFNAQTAYDMALSRRGRWFEPALVDALNSFRNDQAFWSSLKGGRELAALQQFEPADLTAPAGPEMLDRVAAAFARVIDAKSPWTYRHSTGVAELSVAIAQRLGFRAGAIRNLRHAALLHDLGKLGVSNLILDKPDRLSDTEVAIMRRHPVSTAAILARVSCFAGIADSAASHHERLDGAGYHRGLRGSHVSLDARILSVADICDALRASRPYRPGLPVERVIEIMKREVGVALDPDCFEALTHVLHADHSEPASVPAAQIVTALAEDYQQAA